MNDEIGSTLRQNTLNHLFKHMSSSREIYVHSHLEDAAPSVAEICRLQCIYAAQHDFCVQSK